MNTTNLFVELIVVGIGTFIWICLLLMTIFGVDTEVINQLISTPVLIVPTLVIIYLLGIVTDRLADSFFNLTRVEKKHRNHYSGGREEYYKDRAYALLNSAQFAEHYEYSRSRQRICRGWTLSSLLILLSTSIFLWSNNFTSYSWGYLVFVLSVFFIALSLGCWWSWESMNNTELKRIKEQVKALREIEASKEKT